MIPYSLEYFLGVREQTDDYEDFDDEGDFGGDDDDEDLPPKKGGKKK